MIKYTRAVRENTNVLVALAGASGSGKTYSAMQLAAGICAGEPFAMIDTEARRGLHYADQFDFEHLELQPPFTPARYLEVVRTIAKRGFRAVVVDSMSHEWEGEGGVLEMAEVDRRKSPSNWIAPKHEHKKMMNGFLQVGTNLIFCLRANEKMEIRESSIVNQGGSKIQISNMGWQPICEKRFMYEMTASFTFDPVNPGIVDMALPHKVQDQHRMAFPPGLHIRVEAGNVLGQWARGDTIETPDKELWDKARSVAQEGMVALHEWAKNLPPEERAKMKPIGDELNKAAKTADLNIGKGWEKGE